MTGEGPQQPILGVARSALGRKWLPRLQDERLGLALAQRLEAPELVGRVLAARGASLEDAPRLL
ncbi:MAG: single-stranded-DNA-specific exonuclease RecJ, partial [Alphaproteobacteria bacterium]